MGDVSAGFAMTLPPEKAIGYFKAKGLEPTLAWSDMQDEAHAVKFTVAGITKLDVLSDIHASLTRALENGTTFSQFQDDLIPTLRRKGWLGSGLVADEHGELQGKKLMPYRLDTIFRTNIQSAYAAGRYQQQMRTVTQRPYWEYDAVMDSRTRPAHAMLNSRVFAADDPIWATIYPPNGYRCRCWVRALTKAQLDRHPVGLESSAGRMVTIRQPYGTKGETRPVQAYRDPATGHMLTPDAGFHLNPGRGYLAGLGQTLLEKGAKAEPGLAAVAVRETLTGNNRLVSAMNRDTEAWINALTPQSSGDFRRVGALSPGVVSRLGKGALPSAVITLDAARTLAMRDAGGGLWPRLVSALLRPLAVLRNRDGLNMVIGTGADRTVIGLAVREEGLYVDSVRPLAASDAGAEVIEGNINGGDDAA